MTVPDTYVQTKAQLLARCAGGSPEQLLMRDLIETLFTSAADPVAALPANHQTLPISTSVDLEDIGNAINTTGKFTGKVVINNGNGQLVVADGPAAADVWNDLEGVSAHIPIEP